MKLLITTSIQRILSNFGYKISTIGNTNIDLDPIFSHIYAECSEYTYTPIERMYSLYSSVKYILDAKIQGDFVECGVWRGGNCMLIAKALLALGNVNRKIYLYDTFTGMTKPTVDDFSKIQKMNTLEIWNKSQQSNKNDWCYASLDEVRLNMRNTRYPEKNIIYVKGKVEDTIPNIIPNKIALLRLDTDWYESTKHEMIHLFPKLSINGVLILDDYGHWEGAKKAVDEYISKHKVPLLLNRIDYSCRLAIKI